MNNFYLIGLVGNLGSGKSTVRKMLEHFGARGIDADALAHVVLQRGTPSWRTVVGAFGLGILQFNGRIDRRKLGALVFRDSAALLKLESLTHPAVGKMIKDLLNENDKPVVVIEAVKLVQAGMHVGCDALWAVDCEPEVAIDRVMRSRNMQEQDARARLAAQGSFDPQKQLAHVIIDNSGDLEATRAQVRQAWSAIQADTAHDKREWLFGITPVVAKPAASAQPAIETPPTPAIETPPTPVIETPPAPVIETPPTPAVETSPAPVTDLSQMIIAPESVQPVESSIPIELPTPLIVTPMPIATAPEPVPAIETQNEIVARPAIVTPSTPPKSIDVRRSRRNDLEALAVALAKKEKRETPLTREETLVRFGERGYRIAVNGKEIVALVAWEAENLVATVREIWADSAQDATLTLAHLLEMVENEARDLLCEAAILLVEDDAPDYIIAQLGPRGYAPTELAALHPVWRQVVQERWHPEEKIWSMRLREQITTNPF